MPKAKKRRIKRKKGGKSNVYFTEETENAIIRFQEEENEELKKQIFVKDIQPALNKLIENIIFVYKFHTLGEIDILKNDCLSYLYEVLYKFDKSRGSKAFSYFSIIVKNWFIQRVKTRNKKSKSDIQFDKTLMTKLEKSNNQNIVISYEDKLLKNEFLALLKDEIKNWRSKFDKNQEIKVLEAVKILLENPDSVPIYNKKGIYMYLREMTGLNTKQIVTNLSKLKKKYLLFKKRYHAGEM